MNNPGSKKINRKASTIAVGAFFVPKIWRARRDSNPQPLGPKPSTLSVELQAREGCMTCWGERRDSNP